MRTRTARRAVIALSLLALLFSIDAANDADVSPSVLILIVLTGVALAHGILDLASRALQAPRHARTRALLALNAIGVAPAVVAFVVLRGLSLPQRAWAARATLAWMAAIITWTSLVVLGAPARTHLPMQHRARQPRRRPAAPKVRLRLDQRRVVT